MSILGAVSPDDHMVYSLLLHPDTHSSNAFVQLQASQSRSQSRQARVVHASCSSVIDANITLVDALICSTEPDISVSAHKSKDTVNW